MNRGSAKLPRLILLAASLWGAGAPATAQGPEASAQGPSDATEIRETPRGTDDAASVLDAIRQDLVELRFEKAQASLDAMLARPELDATLRTDARILRAQVLVALGRLDAAADDYRAILADRPSFEPDPSVTPTKARQRFEAIRDETVGTIALTLDPDDAQVRVDGREVLVPVDGALRVIAGERQVRVERRGYDPMETRITVPPAGTAEWTARLIPNARTVVVRTEPDGVSVGVDGIPRGETRRPEPGSPAELVLGYLPLGEHEFVLERPCFRSVRSRELIAADLIDRSPRLLDVRQLEPARTRLILAGGPEGGEVVVDGEPAARLPSEPLVLCPGTRTVEILSGGRSIWWERIELPDVGEFELRIEARPNIALIDSQAWPPDLEGFADAFSVRHVGSLPPETTLDHPAEWERLDLPAEIDLAIAVLPSRSPGAPPRRYLWSPLLRTVYGLESGPFPSGRPSWGSAWAGWKLADSSVGGPAMVVTVTPGGPAAGAGILPGDRITAIDGATSEGAASVRTVLAEASPTRRLTVALVAPDGTGRTVEVKPGLSPVLPAVDRPAWRTAVAAAWAAVDAAAGGANADAARANLALALERAGLPQAAAVTWRRVAWPERSGIGAGTSAYYLGRALLASGDEEGARAAFLQAVASKGTAFSHDGPDIAPAAADYLADLGVQVDSRAP